ncbi:MAG: hypothetical protein N2Z21_00885, partial [Candidatus Sumerlaeaceae bacterium]|nr:hypothetical protein [Candidatus Sumerlaeaceae bacterium]
VVPLDLEEIASEVLEAYPFALNQFNQLVFGLENWQGPADSSLRCSVSLTPTALYVEGEFYDDFPFCQRSPHPAKPDWWKLSYGADGIVITIEDQTSPTQKVSFALNWGAQATQLKVDILKSLLATRPDFARGGCIQLTDRGDQAQPTPNVVSRPVHFRAGLPLTELADPQFFERSLVITVELYDIDGDYVSASVLRQSLKTKKAAVAP